MIHKESITIRKRKTLHTHYYDGTNTHTHAHTRQYLSKDMHSSEAQKEQSSPFEKPLQKHSDKHLELKKDTHEKSNPFSFSLKFNPIHKDHTGKLQSYLLVVLRSMSSEVCTHNLRGDTSGSSLISLSVVLNETKDRKSRVQLARDISDSMH